METLVPVHQINSIVPAFKGQNRGDSEIKAVFSVFFEPTNKKVKAMEGRMSKRSKVIEVMEFMLWSNFCVDQYDNIYVSPYGRGKGGFQKIIVFSPVGELLFEKSLDYFVEKQVMNICCDKNSFVFRTRNLEIIIAHRRKK